MNKRPGHVNVTVETGYCNFCGRTRNLRREEHQLGTLVRTIITCESCHRTLSSSVGVASTEPEVAETPTKVETAAQAEAQPKAEMHPKAATRSKAVAQAKAKPEPKRGAARPAASAKSKAPTKRAATKKK